MSFLIVGLGNVGREYADTRHNMGFLVLDRFAGASNASFTTMRYGSLTQTRVAGRDIYLLKPSTYMNLSGKAVRYWMREERIPLENLLVVVDDIALPLGTIRMRKQGSDGGHNGLRSLNECLNTTEYTRLRVGIGNHFGEGQQIDYVLGAWDEQEEKLLPFVVDHCLEAIRTWVLLGVNEAMNRFNCSITDRNN